MYSMPPHLLPTYTVRMRTCNAEIQKKAMWSTTEEDDNDLVVYHLISL